MSMFAHVIIQTVCKSTVFYNSLRMKLSVIVANQK